MGPDKTITRKFNWQSYVLTADTTTSPEIPYQEFISGGYLATAVTTAATVTYYVAQEPTLPNISGTTTAISRPTYFALNDSSNAGITQAISANKAYTVPAGAAPFGSIVMVVDTGSAAVKFCRKS